MKHMWKSLIQPQFDYCSQLYMPTNQVEMGRLENLFRNFSRFSRAKRIILLGQTPESESLFSLENPLGD